MLIPLDSIVKPPGFQCWFPYSIVKSPGFQCWFPWFTMWNPWFSNVESPIPLSNPLVSNVDSPGFQCWILGFSILIPMVYSVKSRGFKYLIPLFSMSNSWIQMSIPVFSMSNPWVSNVESPGFQCQIPWFPMLIQCQIPSYPWFKFQCQCKTGFFFHLNPLPVSGNQAFVPITDFWSHWMVLTTW